MGSFAIQCDISKEPIYSGDYVYAFYLEPNNPDFTLSHLSSPLKSMFQHFKISSLPVYGTYNNYGSVDSVPNHSKKEIELAKKLYRGYDFSNDENSPEPGLSENKMIFAVHKSVFEALVEKGKTLNTKIPISQAMFEESIEVMDKEHLSSYEDKLEPFLKTIALIGHKFKFETRLISSESVDNGIPRHKIHDYVKNKLSIENNAKDTGFFCPITRRSIKTGERLKAFAVQPSHPTVGGFSLRVFKKHNIGGQFGICSPEIDCRINDKGEFIAENNPMFNQMVSNSIIQPSSDLLLELSEGKSISLRNGISYISLMLVPEDVFNLVSDKSHVFLKDYDDWKKAVKIIQTIKDTSTHESMLKCFTDKGFTEYSIKEIIPSNEELTIYNNADQDRLLEIKMQMFMMLEDSLNSIHGREKYFGNEFNTLFGRNEKHINHAMSYDIKKLARLTFKGKADFEILDKYAEFLSVSKKLSDGMWQSGVGIFPSSYIEPTNLSDEIVKIINDSMRKKVSKDYKLAKKFEEQYGPSY